MSAPPPLADRLLRLVMELDYFWVMPALARVSWRAALWWGRRRGDLRFLGRSVGRRAAIANLQRAFGDTLSPAAARRIIRGSFRAQTCEEVETFFYPALIDGIVDRFVTVMGREHLDEALGRGRGAIIFSAHYGSMCLALIVLTRLGYPLKVVARSLDPADNPLGDVVRRYGEAKVAALERCIGNPFIIPGKSGATDRIRDALAAGETVYMLSDVPPELVRHHGRVRFLGHPAELPLGIEYLAAETGAALVPFTVRRSADQFGHVFTIWPRVPGPEAGSGTLQRCVDVLEREIRVDPSQFFMWEYARSFWVDESSAIDGSPVDGYETNAAS